MRFSKIVLVALLVLAVSFSMFACGDPGDGSGTTTTTTTTSGKPQGPEQPSGPSTPSTPENPETPEDNTPGQFKAELLDAATCVITGYTGKFTDTLTVPATVEINGKNYTVVEIADAAFKDAKYITAVVIPDSVKTVGKGAFAGCSAIGEMTLPFVGGSASSHTYIGYLFGADSFSENGKYVPATLKKITLSDACTSIADFAFDSCSSLEEVVFGSHLTEIGDYAFTRCALTAAVLPDSLTSVGIGAFANCALTEMTLPFVGNAQNGENGYIGYLFGAVSYEKNGDFVPASLKKIVITDACTAIGTGAFYQCENIATVETPDTIQTIGRDAFTDTAFYNAMSDGLVYVGKVLYGYKGEMTDTNVVVRDGTLAIAAAAFEGRGITSISIPESVANIGEAAFAGSRLSELSISYVGGSATAGADANFIGYLFGAATAEENASVFPATLKKIVLRANCTAVADKAFYGCAALEEVELGAGVTSLAKNAFFGCSALKSIRVDEANTAYMNDSGLVYNKAGNDLYAVPMAITGKVTLLNITEIGAEQFRDCVGLTEIVLPATLEKIGAHAFAGATAMATVNFHDTLTDVGYAAFLDTAWYNAQPDGLVNTGKVLYRFKGEAVADAAIEIGDNIIGIAAGAFEGCTLSSVIVPTNVKYIGEGAFLNCNVAALSLPYVGASAAEDETKNYIGYLFGAPSVALSPNYIPDSLTAVTLLDGCARLEEYAFTGCDSVVTINIPDSVVYIAGNALDGTGWLAAQTAPGVIYAGLHVYGFNADEMTCSEILAYNASLAPGAEKKENVYCVTLREGTLGIVDEAFRQSDIHEVRMPNSLVYIGESAFENCTNLMHIQMSDGLTSLGRRAFFACRRLPEIYVPGTVISINEATFQQCTGLTSVVIGKGIETIGKNAFNGVVASARFRYTGTEGNWNAISYDESNNVLERATLVFNYTYNRDSYAPCSCKR